MKPTIWNIDTAHSGIHFSVRHMVFARVRGRFAAFRGDIQLDEADLARSRVNVEIDAASIDTGVADRDAHLRSPDFLDAEHFPTLTFASKRVEDLGGGRYRVEGDLTIRGVTREVSLEAEYNGRATDPWGNQRVAFAATASLDRGDFGLEWNQVLEAGGVLVGSKVNIELEVQAVEAAAAQVA